MEHLYEYASFLEKHLNKKITALESSLMAFSNITDIPVSFFSISGKYQWSTLHEKRICSANRDFGSDHFDCTRNLLSSMNISLSLPDAYLFICNSGFVNLCYALFIDEKPYGFLMAGPIAMANSMKKLIDAFSAKMDSLNLDQAKIVPLLCDMKPYSPKEIGYLTTLFTSVISAALKNSPVEDIRHQRYTEQSDISQKLIQMKKEKLTFDYPYTSESALAEAIKSGDLQHCSARFGKYVEDIIVFDQGNMSLTKLRLVSFFTQLLKVDNAWQSNYENLFLIEKINDAQTIKEIMTAGNKLIHALATEIADRNYTGTSEIIKKVIVSLQSNYKEPITLVDIADEIHMNSSYLSTLFKQEMGVSFSAYLNDIRLAHAKQLLKDTALPITDVCMDSGFSSPSYFAKMFKNKYGISPKEFRHSGL